MLNRTEMFDLKKYHQTSQQPANFLPEDNNERLKQYKGTQNPTWKMWSATYIPMLRRIIQNIPFTRFSGFRLCTGFPSSNCDIKSNKHLKTKFFFIFIQSHTSSSLNKYIALQGANNRQIPQKNNLNRSFCTWRRVSRLRNERGGEEHREAEQRSETMRADEIIERGIWASLSWNWRDEKLKPWEFACLIHKVSIIGIHEAATAIASFSRIRNLVVREQLCKFQRIR